MAAPQRRAPATGYSQPAESFDRSPVRTRVRTKGLSSHPPLGPTAFAPDLGHVVAITGDHPAAFTASFARFFRREFVRSLLRMSGFPTGSRDLALLVGIHPRETAPGLSGHVA
jgi:hypothetical protein